jgi:hypothetical protein
VSRESRLPWVTLDGLDISKPSTQSSPASSESSVLFSMVLLNCSPLMSVKTTVPQSLMCGETINNITGYALNCPSLIADARSIHTTINSPAEVLQVEKALYSPSEAQSSAWEQISAAQSASPQASTVSAESDPVTDVCHTTTLPIPWKGKKQSTQVLPLAPGKQNTSYNWDKTDS